MAYFRLRECWAGVDLSMTTDLSAVSFVFPRDEEKAFDVLVFCWIPEEGVRKREQRMACRTACGWSRDSWRVVLAQ
jgi:phage terminase large subunit-like protein